MIKSKIVISTILPERKYLQLGLHNLKSYSMKNCVNSNYIDICLYEINPDTYHHTHGTTFPFLNENALFKHALKILKKKPTIIGFSCFMWNIDLILQICRIIKTLDRTVILVLGGPEASIDPRKLLKQNTNLDLIVKDEGEVAFSKIIDTIYSNERNYSTIQGVTYRVGHRIYQNEYTDIIDLKTLPSPYLNHHIPLGTDVSLALETSRGCPFTCAYCTYSIRGYHKLRFFPIERILKELRYILPKNPKSLRITDDNFNINPPRAILILNQIKKYIKDTEIKIFLNASMWAIDKALIKLLKKNDLTCSVGVQSVNEKALKLISRKNNLSILEENLMRFDKYKMKYELSFIIGLPGENFKEILKSINWAAKFNPKEINLFPLMVFEGTKMQRDSKQLGLSTYERPYYVIKETRNLSKVDIKKGIVLREYIGLIYNQGFLRKTIGLLAENLDFQFADIVEKMGKIIKMGEYAKNTRRTQRAVVKNFINKYAPKYIFSQLTNAMNSDYSYYESRTNKN